MTFGTRKHSFKINEDTMPLAGVEELKHLCQITKVRQKWGCFEPAHGSQNPNNCRTLPWLPAPGSDRGAGVRVAKTEKHP